MLENRIPDFQINQAALCIRILQEYRSRQFTQHKDQAMAQAGTAREFVSIHGCTYLAGHFAEYTPQLL